MLNQRTQGSPTFKSRYRYLEYPKLPHRPRTGGNTIGSGGSIVSALGTENTSFATGWPMRRPIAKSENGWSTGFAKCITNANGAVIADRVVNNLQAAMTCDALVLGIESG